MNKNPLRFHIDKRATEYLKNLIEAIFRKLNENINTPGGVKNAKKCIPMISKAVDFYPDRQIITLNMVHSMLLGRRDPGELGGFISIMFGSLMDDIFNLVPIPPNSLKTSKSGTLGAYSWKMSLDSKCRRGLR